MSPEPGWYYAEGDPVDTVRRWNGEEWIGFPITQPGSEEAQPKVYTHVKAAGHVSLKVPAVLAQVALLLLALASLALAFSYFQLAGTREGIEALADDDASQFGLAYLLQIGATVLAGITFIVWFSIAYRNISLWATTRRSAIWPVIAWFIPFMNLVRPMSMMLELVEHSPRPDRRGELSPTPVILWWFLWMLPAVAGALIAINVASRDLREVAKSIFIIQGFVTILNTAAVLLAIYLVQTITDSQERRRRL